MKFRNYVPQDKELQEGKLAPPVLPKFEDPVAAAPPPSEKEEVIFTFKYQVSLVVVYVLFFLSYFFFFCLYFCILNLGVFLGSFSQHCSKEAKLGLAKRCAEET